MPEKTRPFLFDQNDFNDHQVVIPVYSGEELDSAKKESIEAGRVAGLNEAKGQREKLIADLLGAIKTNFSTLFAAEEERNAKFEAETTMLARGVFTKLFPGLNEREGLTEILRMISLVLEGQRAQPEIIIEVRTEYADEVREHLGKALSASGIGICTITGNDTLGPGDCRLRWEDGGAQRSATALSQQVAALFERMLAGREPLRDNQMLEAPPDALPPPTGE